MLFSAAVAWLFFAAAGARAQEFAIAGVASVIDGDTIEIHGELIRLSGFDSPERGSMCGHVNVYQRASLALADHIASRTVSCSVFEHDRYNRSVAHCSVGGEDVGDYMVTAGWARDWPRYSHWSYAGAEALARRAQRGIWGLACPADLWGSRDYSPDAAHSSRPG